MVWNYISSFGIQSSGIQVVHYPFWLCDSHTGQYEWLKYGVRLLGHPVNKLWCTFCILPIQGTWNRRRRWFRLGRSRPGPQQSGPGQRQQPGLLVGQRSGSASTGHRSHKSHTVLSEEDLIRREDEWTVGGRALNSTAGWCGGYCRPDKPPGGWGRVLCVPAHATWSRQDQCKLIRQSNINSTQIISSRMDMSWYLSKICRGGSKRSDYHNIKNKYQRYVGTHRNKDQFSNNASYSKCTFEYF